MNVQQGVSCADLGPLGVGRGHAGIDTPLSSLPAELVELQFTRGGVECRNGWNESTTQARLGLALMHLCSARRGRHSRNPTHYTGTRSWSGTAVRSLFQVLITTSRWTEVPEAPKRPQRSAMS